MEMALGQYAGIHQFTSPWAASLLHGDGTRTIRRFEPTKTILVLYASSVLVKGLGSILTTNNFSDLQNMTKFIFIFALRCKIIKRQLYVFLLKNIS